MIEFISHISLSAFSFRQRTGQGYKGEPLLSVRCYCVMLFIKLVLRPM